MSIVDDKLFYRILSAIVFLLILIAIFCGCNQVQILDGTVFNDWDRSPIEIVHEGPNGGGNVH